MATFIISGVIFGFAGYILYKKIIKKESSCNCGTSECPTKQKITSK